MIGVARAFAFVALIPLVAACQNHTDLGPCIGVNDKQDPAFSYRISTRNVVVGIVFVEAVVPPVVVALDELYCPVSRATALTK